MPRRSRSTSRSRSPGSRRKKGCRGGSTLKQLRKSAKACGLKGYSKLKKCTLQNKLRDCGGLEWVPKAQQSRKKYKTRSRKSHSRRTYRWKHKFMGKHVILA